ncbi:hypothetical protein E2562_031668 [Oryza meyeriana var. granulata]|uniref:Uncharacterized protein n=1 Tax=Oryza meyeriana var. granulata TaxID=110450 RepID=A0A6G1E505_9ORYZ|nr:hypothetical protein E2562_031668 [Oryza meyeriana var. granulata]
MEKIIRTEADSIAEEPRLPGGPDGRTPTRRRPLARLAARPLGRSPAPRMASPPKDGSASPQPGEEGVTPAAGSSSAADGSSTPMASSPPPALRIQAGAGGSSPETPTSSRARCAL